MPKIPVLPLVAVNGSLDWFLLTGRRPSYPYGDNHKRISDVPEKYNYDVCLPGNCYTALTVSVPGSTDALSAVSDEQIAEACAALRPVLVRFTNATVRIYTINGEQKMSATADAVELVKANK